MLGREAIAAFAVERFNNEKKKSRDEKYEKKIEIAKEVILLESLMSLEDQACYYSFCCENYVLFFIMRMHNL